MNILLINHYAGSPEHGMEFRPYYMAEEWGKMGHNVTIIAADYSHLRSKNPVIEHDFTCEKINKITYCWVHTSQYEGNGVKRAITMAQFLVKLWLNTKRIVKKIKPDVVITSSTYPLDTFVGQRIRRISKKKIKLIHEVHDMWPATLYEVGGMSKKNPFVIAMQIGENSAYRRSDEVVSLLPFAKEYMMKHGLNENKFHHIPNGIRLEEWQKPLELTEDIKTFFEENKDKFIVGYFGGHALSNNLNVLLDTAKITDDEEILYVLFGKGVEKEALVKRKVEEKIENLVFMPAVPKKMIPNVVKEFDCIYMGAMDSPLYKYGICFNKMYDSMMAGKPIVAAINIKSCEVDMYDCGVMANADKPQNVLEKILYIKNADVDKRTKMGENGKKAVIERYNFNNLAKQFEALFV